MPELYGSCATVGESLSPLTRRYRDWQGSGGREPGAESYTSNGRSITDRRRGRGGSLSHEPARRRKPVPVFPTVQSAGNSLCCRQKPGREAKEPKAATSEMMTASAREADEFLHAAGRSLPPRGALTQEPQPDKGLARGMWRGDEI
jgi:hypothetical protein